MREAGVLDAGAVLLIRARSRIVPGRTVLLRAIRSVPFHFLHLATRQPDAAGAIQRKPLAAGVADAPIHRAKIGRRAAKRESAWILRQLPDSLALAVATAHFPVGAHGAHQELARLAAKVREAPTPTSGTVASAIAAAFLQDLGRRGRRGDAAKRHATGTYALAAVPPEIRKRRVVARDVRPVLRGISVAAMAAARPKAHVAVAMPVAEVALLARMSNGLHRAHGSLGQQHEPAAIHDLDLKAVELVTGVSGKTALRSQRLGRGLGDLYRQRHAGSVSRAHGADDDRVGESPQQGPTRGGALGVGAGHRACRRCDSDGKRADAGAGNAVRCAGRDAGQLKPDGVARRQRERRLKLERDGSRQLGHGVAEGHLVILHEEARGRDGTYGSKRRIRDGSRGCVGGQGHRWRRQGPADEFQAVQRIDLEGICGVCRQALPTVHGERDGGAREHGGHGALGPSGSGERLRRCVHCQAGDSTALCIVAASGSHERQLEEQRFARGYHRVGRDVQSDAKRLTCLPGTSRKVTRYDAQVEERAAFAYLGLREQRQAGGCKGAFGRWSTPQRHKEIYERTVPLACAHGFYMLTSSQRSARRRETTATESRI
eukprot:scaffold427_cov263-Pinguiococcus_pyrenoidosus.AAC.17